MSRVFVSAGTSAVVYVFSNDHCPPHVSARHRGEEWIARVRFSYLQDTVELWSIAPTQHTPPQRVINRLLDDVRSELRACRRHWWLAQHTTCLENQWVRLAAESAIEPLAQRIPEAKQIIRAIYDAETGRLSIEFSDGTSSERRVIP